jgi:hypothetical protein
MKRWKYLLVVVVLVSRFVELLLYEVSDVSDWCWYLFTGGWFVLLFLTLWALFRIRWRELAVFSLVLVTTALSAINIGIEPIIRVQDEVFRIYALYRIRAVPLEQFLSKCKLNDYVDDDGNRQQVGRCREGFRVTPWFYLDVIYDPSGQLALPGYLRTITWRLAVQGRTGSGSRLPSGSNLGAEIARSDAGRHLVGSFYYLKIYLEDLTGDDEK